MKNKITKRIVAIATAAMLSVVMIVPAFAGSNDGPCTPPCAPSKPQTHSTSSSNSGSASSASTFAMVAAYANLFNQLYGVENPWTTVLNNMFGGYTQNYLNTAVASQGGTVVDNFRMVNGVVDNGAFNYYAPQYYLQTLDLDGLFANYGIAYMDENGNLCLIPVDQTGNFWANTAYGSYVIYGY